MLIGNIKEILQHLEDGRVYELSGTPGEARLSTHIGKLRKQLIDLLNKIQNGKESDEEEIARTINGM